MEPEKSIILNTTTLACHRNEANINSRHGSEANISTCHGNVTDIAQHFIIILNLGREKYEPTHDHLKN